jgi:hypothetical protein
MGVMGWMGVMVVSVFRQGRHRRFIRLHIYLRYSFVNWFLEGFSTTDFTDDTDILKKRDLLMDRADEARQACPP